MLSDEEDNLIDFLEENFGCHTVVLYGSRAQGTNRPDSDWDVLGITDVGQRNFVHEPVEGVGEVNAYIHNSDDVPFKPAAPSGLYQPLSHFMRLRHGRVLVEQDGIGKELVQRANELYRKGPPPMSAQWRAQHTYFLLGYGVGRLRRPQTTPALWQFTRCEMLPRSLALYFELRRMWPPSPKDALHYLSLADQQGLALFEAALAPGATTDEVEAWAQHVVAVDPLG